MSVVGPTRPSARVGVVIRVLGCVTRCAALAAVIALGFIPAHAAYSDEASISAFLVWEGEGHAVGTAPNLATFTGTLAGIFYVQTDEGPVEAGIMACPTVIDVSMTDGSQTGRGRCTFTAKDDAIVYSEFSCSGVYSQGCRGDYKLIAGTGRFQGVTGGGHMVLRSDQKQFAVGAATAATRARGVVFWRDLHLKLQ